MQDAQKAVDAVKSGHNILILTDRRMDADNVAIPALLATSAVHQHLVAKGLRTRAGLVVETGCRYFAPRSNRTQFRPAGVQQPSAGGQSSA